jgi:hypothetical protein
MTIATYLGVVREGRIHLIEQAPLEEGSQVYVVVPGIVDERTARRKANRWLIENVGNMIMADRSTLLQSSDRATWRFEAFITASSHEPLGPIGQVDVDAATGQVLTDVSIAEEMIRRGEHFGCALPSAEG